VKFFYWVYTVEPEGLALILPIDYFCDMFRSATNVLVNNIVTSVVENGKKLRKLKSLDL
jgi:Na+/H+-dicarboxylate symporter